MGRKRIKNKRFNKKSIGNQSEVKNPKSRSISKILSASFISLLFAAFGVFYPPISDYWSGRFGGRLSLGVLNEKIPENEPVYIFFSTPNNNRGSKYIVPVQLTIFNEFKNSEESVSLSLKYPKVSGRSLFDESYVTHSGIRSKSEIFHEINSSKQYDYSLYKLDFLPKGSDFAIIDAAITSKIDYGERFPVLFEKGQGLDVEATVYSEGDRERTWNLKYRAVNVRSALGLQAWVQQYYGKSIAIDLRRELTFFQYLRGLILGRDITVYGFEPHFNEALENDLYIPRKGLEQYKGFKFDPYVWGLLFAFKGSNNT
ncbi:hypothetical protein DFO67_10743 [Modicisalibacter xianhensis]|uniref:Uncharacterized protein n=1 Tax=Modicisalibacter xianhensis TaxID=442341 RepID=A0A4R8FV03_9GAMM|nr:hypothetical protein [Halomonas xianhensis]TDX29367.1 hypothetical protein DFO67_10743 [Halomonas xianhensis]